MNKSNLSSEEDSIFDMSVMAKDSPTLDTGYSNFLNIYKQVCDENLTNEEKLVEAKRQWAKMTEEQRMQFVPEKSNPSLSVKSVSGAQLLEAPVPAATVKNDQAFNNFMETFTIRLSQKAAKRWEAMSQREREAYAAKDDVGDSPSASPQVANDTFGKECGQKKKIRRCAKPVKKCPKPRPKCSKKPKCAKRKPKCSKPKPKCRKPKPPCMR